MGDYSNLTNCQSTENEGEGEVGGGGYKNTTEPYGRIR